MSLGRGRQGLKTYGSGGRSAALASRRFRGCLEIDSARRTPVARNIVTDPRREFAECVGLSSKVRIVEEGQEGVKVAAGALPAHASTTTCSYTFDNVL